MFIQSPTLGVCNVYMELEPIFNLGSNVLEFKFFLEN
jgi:hypothetical protein